MIAALGMYDRPEIREANDRLWSLIRSELDYGPQDLTRQEDMWSIWQSPDLLLAQTCGLPFRHRLHKNVQLVGTPDYAVEGCPPGYYRSVIVARRGGGADLGGLENLRFAYNEKLSQSGWAAFWGHVPIGSAPKELVQTGAHLASAQAVSEGLADIASLDAVTWNLIQAYERFAKNLVVLAETRPTPGLPLITSTTQNAAEIRDAVQNAIHALEEESKNLLQIRDFVSIARESYLAEPLPPV